MNYGEKLAAGGEKSRCGWLKDKYGLSWQVIPRALGEMLQERSDSEADYVLFLVVGPPLYNGTNHLQKARDMAPYAESKGIPAPELAVKLSAVPLIFGGASLLLGVKPKLGALAILGFLAGVSPIMHDFWRMENPEERMKNMIDFMKNTALAGGALALMGVDEPWEASVPVEQLNVAQPRLARKIRKLGRKLAA